MLQGCPGIVPDSLQIKTDDTFSQMIEQSHFIICSDPLLDCRDQNFDVVLVGHLSIRGKGDDVRVHSLVNEFNHEILAAFKRRSGINIARIGCSAFKRPRCF